MAERVTSGQRIRTTPLYQASVQNRLMAMLEAFEGGKLKGLQGGNKLRGPQTDIVHVKNLTGADLALGSVVQLGASLIDDVAGLWFDGNLVAAPVFSKIAIVREPLPEDVIGVAQVGGVCVALVDVIDVSHTRAAPVVGETVLTSGFGPIEILSPPDGTGEQLMAVCFGHNCLLRCTTDAAIAQGATGTVSILAGVADDTDSGIDIDAYNPLGDIEADIIVVVGWVNGGPEIIAAECGA